MTSGIYILTNLNQDSTTYGWKYIGKSENCDERVKVHFRKSSNQLLRNTLSHYGTARIRVEIIPAEICDLDELEVFLIREHLESHYPLFNKTLGGDGGNTYQFRTESEMRETRERISNAGKGRIVSEETKLKIAEKHRGRKHSNNSRHNMRMGKLGNKNPNFGKPRDEETKIKISQSNKGKTRSPESCLKMRKPQNIIVCPYCNKTGGNVLRRYHFDNCKLKPS